MLDIWGNMLVVGICARQGQIIGVGLRIIPATARSPGGRAGASCEYWLNNWLATFQVDWLTVGAPTSHLFSTEAIERFQPALAQLAETRPLAEIEQMIAII